MNHVRRLVYVAVIILNVTLLGYCENENYFEVVMESEEIVDPHSFYYDKYNKKMIKNTDANEDFQIPENSKEEYNVLKSELNMPTQVENNSHERIFYKRLVNLLLSNINIQTENDASVIGIIQIEMSHSQMELLQNFHTEKASLREIDEILSNIIKKPQHSYVSDVVTVFNILHEKLSMALEIVQEHPDGAMTIFTMIVIYLAFKMIKWRQGISLFVIIQLILVVSFMMTWWGLIQEAEIKNMAELKKFDTIPLACEPHKMNMWHKFVAFIYSNEDCEKYYQATMSNPKLKITPAFALSHFITTVILHPITHMGTVVSGFINNATDGLPWTYGWIVRLLLFLCVGFVIIALPFCLSGASINLGLGPLFRFGIDYQKKDRKGKSFESITNREPVQIILQVSSGTNVPAIKDEPNDEQSKALRIFQTNNLTENVPTDKGNSEVVGTDLSSGDTAENDPSLNNNSTKNKKSSELNEPSIDKNDGSGDGY